MNSAKRVEKYLIRRDGMRCYDNVIHAIDAGEPTEGWLTANDIASVLKQRAELLEALKQLVSAVKPGWCSAMDVAIKAIESAEGEQ